MASVDPDSQRFRIPVKWVPADRFAAIDCGTSLLKLVYIRKEDRDLLKSTDRETRVDIYTKNFPLDQLTETLDFIVAKSVPAEGARGLTFTATGLMAGPSVQTIQQRLGTRVLNVFELDCHVDSAYKLVSSTPKAEVVHPLSTEAQNNAWTFLRAATKMDVVLEQASRLIDYPIARLPDGYWLPTPLADTNPATPYGRADPEVWPFLLVMLGSTGASFLVQPDGLRCECVDLQQSSGRTFIGLGTMLTGTKSYNELMELAEKGDNTKCDILMSEGFEGNVSEEYLAFQQTGRFVRSYFGNGYQTNLSDWKKEDVARSLLCMVSANIAQWVMNTAAFKKVKKVLIGGSFTNHPLARYELTTCFHSLRCFQPNLELEFFKLGGHMGALGSLMCELSPQVTDFPAPE